MTKPLPGWAVVPLNAKGAAAALGITENALYQMLGRYPDLSARRGKKHVFYAEHMERLRTMRESGRAKPSAATALYRHFAADGTLLYIGISRSIAARLAAHAQSGWDRQIATITVEWFDDRATAEEAERQAVKAGQPVHNSIYNNGDNA